MSYSFSKNEYEVEEFRVTCHSKKQGSLCMGGKKKVTTGSTRTRHQQHNNPHIFFCDE